MPLYGIAVGLFIPSSLITLQSLVPPSHLTIGIAVLTLGLDLGSSMGSLASGLLLSLAELDIIIPATSAVAGLASAILVWALRLSASEVSGSSEGLAKPNKSIAKNTGGGG
jgi:predicted MFS family arabinose efflux permease